MIWRSTTLKTWSAGMQRTDTPPAATRGASPQTALGQIASIAVRPVVAVPLLTLLALALRLYKLGYHDYFDDEVISTFVARLPAAEIFRSITANDTHPPGYHILLHFWRAVFGESLIALRLFSVLISAACVPLTYALGRRLASAAAGVAAATLMAIAPFQIYHGQQARMYPLLALLVLLATLLFVRAWRRAGWLPWSMFGLVAIVGLYTHIYFPLSLLALDLWALYDTYAHRRIYWGRWAGLMIAQALAALAFLPYLPSMLGTVRSVVRAFWIQPNTAFDWMFDLLSLANNATLATLPGYQAPAWYVVATYLPAVAAVMLALIYSVREARRVPAERAAWALLHLLIWVPIVVATAISLTIRPILLDRSLIGLSSALFVIMGWMFARFAHRRAVRLVGAAFVISCFAGIAHAAPNQPVPNDLRQVADYLARQARPGDAIAYVDWQPFDAAALTHPDQDGVYVLPGQITDTPYWQRRMAAMRWHTPQNVAPVAEFGPQYRRVWLVYTLFTAELDYHKAVDQRWLEEHGRRVDRVEFSRAVVLLYELTQ
jgi:4-amino-4-deoxy-L-arabinose transferase-like glycosyltransferase